ncbi:MAG: inositol monophosphatase family protein [Pseudomonadota bacterium]
MIDRNERSEFEATAMRRAVIDFETRMLEPLLIAGRYALRLQSRLKQDEHVKDGDAWQSALTDADIGVQQVFEAFVLAEFPTWNFFGEEHESTSNAGYFPTSADACVMLDPINGTRLYRDQSIYFDVLVSLSWQGRIIATMSYHPARERLFGANIFGANYVRSGPRLATISLLPPPSPVNNAIGTYQTGDALRSEVSQVHPTFDFSLDYDPGDARCCLNSVFTGELSGYLMLDCAILDIGATAFAVERAGGVASKPDGSSLEIFDRFDPESRHDLLVVRDRGLHARVASAIKKSGLWT